MEFDIGTNKDWIQRPTSILTIRKGPSVLFRIRSLCCFQVLVCVLSILNFINSCWSQAPRFNPCMWGDNECPGLPHSPLSWLTTFLSNQGPLYMTLKSKQKTLSYSALVMSQYIRHGGVSSYLEQSHNISKQYCPKAHTSCITNYI